MADCPKCGEKFDVTTRDNTLAYIAHLLEHLVAPST
jgi:hypothetical protein